MKMSKLRCYVMRVVTLSIKKDWVIKIVNKD